MTQQLEDALKNVLTDLFDRIEREDLWDQLDAMGDMRGYVLSLGLSYDETEGWIFDTQE